MGIPTRSLRVNGSQRLRLSGGACLRIAEDAIVPCLDVILHPEHLIQIKVLDQFSTLSVSLSASYQVGIEIQPCLTIRIQLRPYVSVQGGFKECPT